MIGIDKLSLKELKKQGCVFYYGVSQIVVKISGGEQAKPKTSTSASNTETMGTADTVTMSSAQIEAPITTQLNPKHGAGTIVTTTTKTAVVATTAVTGSMSTVMAPTGSTAEAKIVEPVKASTTTRGSGKRHSSSSASDTDIISLDDIEDTGLDMITEECPDLL